MGETTELRKLRPKVLSAPPPNAQCETNNLRYVGLTDLLVSTYSIQE